VSKADIVYLAVCPWVELVDVALISQRHTNFLLLIVKVASYC
jgi:hypothetical protein